MTSDELLQVLSTCKGTGTSWGISYYKTRCARKARLDREAKELGESESSFNAKVGTLFHKLEELYYTDQLGSIALPIDDDADCDNDPVQEVLRVFAGYISVFPKDEFTTVGCETYLPDNAGDCPQCKGIGGKACGICEGMGILLTELGKQQKPLIEAAVGVIPFTLRPDQVIGVDTRQAQGMRVNRRVDLESGFYLKDTKTSEKKDSAAQWKYELEIQFPSYILSWNAAYPDKQAKGMLVNNVVRHQDLTKKENDGAWRSFRTFYIQAPTPMQVEALRAYLREKGEYLKTDKCELMACSDWGVCPHYTNGNCSRM